ncbi:MAG: P-loop NTPase [Clostridia bacterium]|nr:P-loop NTPase [Clostridia bacterium]
MQNIFLVASGKGGVGKSSLTAFLGRALVKLNKRVLLIDLDIALRSLDLILGVTEKCVYDWGDVLEGRAMPEQAVVKGENGNPDLLCAPVRSSSAIDAAGLLLIIQSIKDNYDYIFLDAPAGLGVMLSIGAAVANKAIVVATPDEVCVRSAGVAADKIRSFGFNGEIRLVINRYRKKESKKGMLLNADTVIDKTYVQLIGIVPEDSLIAFHSVKSAFGFVGPASKAFMRIAKRLEGEQIPLKFTKL